MKNALITYLLLFLMLSLNAKTLKLKIVDEKYKALSDVIISSEKQLALSDSNGYAYIKTDNENLLYEIKKISYETQKFEQKTLLNKKIILLKRKSILLHGTQITAESEQIAQQIRTSDKINKSEMRDKTVNSIADWLSNQQGIYIKGNELSGEKKSLSLGGHSAKHTIVMLNGVALNPTGQEIDLSNILAEHIESIEIIKNNASVESGSGAIGGIILIKTSSAVSVDNLSSEFNYGSFNSYKFNTNLNKKIQTFYVNANYNLSASDNNFSFHNRQTGNQSTRNDNSKFQESLNLSFNNHYKKLNLDFITHLSEFKNFLPGTYNYLNAYKGSFIKGYSLKNTLNLKNNIWHCPTELIIYSLLDHTNYQNLKAPFHIYYSDNLNDQSITGLKFAISKKIHNLEIKPALEFKNEQFKSTDKLKPAATIGLLKRNTSSGILSSYYACDYDLFNFDSQASFRLDYNKDFKENFSCRFEQKIKYNSYIPLELSANLGKSYMLPSFYDLYWKGDSQTTGNPNLKPESSFGYRCNLKIGDNPSLEQAYWLNNTENLIYWYRSLSAWKPGNISNAEIKNLESQFKYSYLDKLEFNLSYNRTIAKNKTLNPDGSHADFYNKYLIYTPSYQWHGTLKYKFAFFTQSLEYNAVGKQYSKPDQLIPALDSYDKWDTHSSFESNFCNFTQKLSISLLNILNENYEIYDYIPEPGFHWQIMLKISKNI